MHYLTVTTLAALLAAASSTQGKSQKFPLNLKALFAHGASEEQALDGQGRPRKGNGHAKIMLRKKAMLDLAGDDSLTESSREKEKEHPEGKLHAKERGKEALELGDRVKALPGASLRREAYFNDGDNGTITKLEGFNGEKEKFLVTWDQSGKTTSTRTAAWRSQFEVISKAPKLAYLDRGCYERGNTQQDRDKACEGDYVCARDGFDGRRFGCASSHCCAFNEESPNGTKACDSWCDDDEHNFLAWRGKRCDWSRCAACEDCEHPKSQQSEIFMRYMPRANLVVCACAKCGSTSMYSHIYENVFGHEWNYSGPPYAQYVLSDRWEGEFQVIQDQDEQKRLMSSAFSFALIREPKERLISAWKSKISCDDKRFGVDKTDRVRMVRVLQSFLPEDQRRNISCMSLDNFLETLKTIHKLGREVYLDKHFLPQDLGCFYRFPPSSWSQVVSIADNKAFVGLSRRLGTRDPPPLTHASKDMTNISLTAVRLLDEVTTHEYTMLNSFLHRNSARVEKDNHKTSKQFLKSYSTKAAHVIGSRHWRHTKPFRSLRLLRTTQRHS